MPLSNAHPLPSFLVHPSARLAVLSVPFLLLPCLSSAQEPSSAAASAPASVPAGAIPQQPSTGIPVSSLPRPAISSRQAREADDAYLAGARSLDHGDLTIAEREFTRAVSLNPGDRDYALALIVTREHRLTALVQRATQARRKGDTAQADALLEQARAIDPNNRILTQHLQPLADPIDRALAAIPDPPRVPKSAAAALLAGAPSLTPQPGTRTLHERGSGLDVIRNVYRAWGISVQFDSELRPSQPLRLDLEDVDFETAVRTVGMMTKTFAIPVQENAAVIAGNTQDARDRLQPLVEETMYLPGVTADQMTELANLARNVFELRTVTASATTGSLILRGDEPTLRVLNATYADMLGGGADVVLDVTIYEIAKSRTRNIGTALPSSIGAFPVAAELQNLLNQNQTLIQQAIANNLLTLTGDPAKDIPAELGILYAAGALNISQFTGLLGVVGKYNGLPLAGVFLGSTTSLNLSLNSSDFRSLDAVQVRGGDRQPTQFRLGTRYPIITSTYTSGVSSALSSQLAGVNIGGRSAASLLSQYLGTSSVTVPQIQFEDLGLTLKTTPSVLRNGDVNLTFDLKIESLGGTSINNIPILNNRQLTSTISVPAGQTALLISAVSSQELKSAQGLPGLNELPGFQGTDKSSEKDTDELLITITPHVVRSGDLRIQARALAVPHPSSNSE